MSTRDLFELASLDALGLLDETERESFEKAFRAAPPHVQAQVRRQQLHFTQIDDLLPDVAPPPGLKARVMAAVRQAITAVANEGPVVARIGPGSSFSAFMNFAPMWRAACIGFATASLVLGWFLMGFATESKRIEGITNNTAIIAKLQREAGDYLEILSLAPDQRRMVSFAPLAMDVVDGPSAVLYIEAETNRAILMCSHLPHGSGEYSLVVKGDGPVEEVRQARFAPNGGIAQAVAIKHLDTDNYARLALVHSSDPDAILVADGM